MFYWLVVWLGVFCWLIFLVLNFLLWLLILVDNFWVCGYVWCVCMLCWWVCFCVFWRSVWLVRLCFRDYFGLGFYCDLCEELRVSLFNFWCVIICFVFWWHVCLIHCYLRCCVLLKWFFFVVMRKCDRGCVFFCVFYVVDLCLGDLSWAFCLWQDHLVTCEVLPGCFWTCVVLCVLFRVFGFVSLFWVVVSWSDWLCYWGGDIGGSNDWCFLVVILLGWVGFWFWVFFFCNSLVCVLGMCCVWFFYRLIVIIFFIGVIVVFWLCVWGCFWYFLLGVWFVCVVVWGEWWGCVRDCCVFWVWVFG